MRHIIKSRQITYLRYRFLRMQQQLASRPQPVLRDKLPESHPLAIPEPRTESRAVHPHLGSYVIQPDRVYIMSHDISTHLLHPTHIPLYPHRMAGKRAIRRPEDDRQQTEHLAEPSQLIQPAQPRQHAENHPGTLRPELQRHSRENDTRKPVPQLGENLDTPLYKTMTESHHQITDAPPLIRRRRVVLPMMMHIRRNQHHIPLPKRLQSITRRPCPTPTHHIVQLPRLMPVQPRLYPDIHTLVYEKKRVVLHLRQFIRDYRLFHHTTNSVHTNIRQLFETIRQI
ncbi:unknown [Tannerella sp. CAG:118]|nr:unknown [Tannerella sp. CAG:118]